MISIIIPAHNEETLLGVCLARLLDAAGPDGPVEVIVAANGCRDGTVKVAEGLRADFAARDWGYHILDLPEGGKPGALNAADQQAQFAMRAYLDADVTIAPDLVKRTVAALNRPEPAYASGAVRIAATGVVSRRYARFWGKVPFMAEGVPGCGFFAVNGAGRARWTTFPDIISDDTFVRLQFAPEERHLVASSYNWPIAEGFMNLIRVRRRQDAGVREIGQKFPELLRNAGPAGVSAGDKFRMALGDPIGFLTYSSVALVVKLLPAPKEWSRGR